LLLAHAREAIVNLNRKLEENKENAIREQQNEYIDQNHLNLMMKEEFKRLEEEKKNKTGH